MSELINQLFKDKKVNLVKLKSFGFKKSNDGYLYEAILPTSKFKLFVFITQIYDIKVEVIDPEMNEVYNLYLIDGVKGEFVGKVREEVAGILDEIAIQCFDVDIFKSEMCKRVIDYVKDKYDDDLEFLWKKFSNNAIWRRKDNRKWYGAILTLSKCKLNFDSDEVVEVIDLRVKEESLQNLLLRFGYYPAYHMNKKHWCTILLDGSVPYEEICLRIDESYRLALK